MLILCIGSISSITVTIIGLLIQNMSLRPQLRKAGTLLVEAVIEVAEVVVAVEARAMVLQAAEPY